MLIGVVVNFFIQVGDVVLLFYRYQNIVLSGGSTMFKDFHRRLQRDIKKIVDARLHASEARVSGELKVSFLFFDVPQCVFAYLVMSLLLSVAQQSIH